MSRIALISTLPSLEFRRVCNCRGVSNENVIAGAQQLVSSGSEITDKTIYAAALELRQHDIIDGKGPMQSGLEGGEGYNCTRQACQPVFEEVAAILRGPDFRKTIPILANSQPAAIGRCGNDCNTCAPATVTENGCTPR